MFLLNWILQTTNNRQHDVAVMTLIGRLCQVETLLVDAHQPIQGVFRFINCLLPSFNALFLDQFISVFGTFNVDNVQIYARFAGQRNSSLGGGNPGIVLIKRQSDIVHKPTQGFKMLLGNCRARRL